MSLPLFEPDIQNLTGVHLAVAGILLDRRGKWTKSKDIGQQIRVSQITVRHVCQELVDNFGLLVAGDRIRGFQLVDDVATFDQYQVAGVKQCLTGLARAKARLGEKRFRALIAKLSAKDGLEAIRETAL